MRLSLFLEQHENVRRSFVTAKEACWVQVGSKKKLNDMRAAVHASAIFQTHGQLSMVCSADFRADVKSRNIPVSCVGLRASTQLLESSVVLIPTFKHKQIRGVLRIRIRHRFVMTKLRQSKVGRG